MLVRKTETPRRIPMKKNREQKMLLYLDSLEEVNEQLMGILRECVNMIDLFLPLGDHRKKWLDAYRDIRKLIETSERIVQYKRELLN
jgi:hypothetical protein